MESLPSEQREEYTWQTQNNEAFFLLEGIIKFVYGDTAGDDMIDWMYDDPQTFVPVLLNRIMIKNSDYRMELVMNI